ncbi:MAG: hypothetical protein QOG17_2010 [Gammaproteobacteria bacterium]|nr:hypothetical protein [Gammaproteobacteria bacterium]
MFKIIAIVVIVGIAAFLAYVATKPDALRIERSQLVKATPETVFALIDDLHRFNSWNPFALIDPSLKIVYSGPASGKGAAYDWDGTGKAGKGHMEITDSASPSEVAMRLEFEKPFAAKNNVTFTLAPDGSATKVTWAMSGQNNYVQKLMGTLFNMDGMVGGEFAKGLANLKAIAER